MNALKVAPTIMEELQKQLSGGALIQSFYPKSLITTGVLAEDVDGAFEAIMKKVDVNAVAGIHGATVTCDEGELVDKVIQMFSQQQKLFLIPGVDYEEMEGVVCFGGQEAVVIQVPILKTAVMFHGVLTITIKNKAFEIPSGPLKVNLEEAMLSFALLSSKIHFEGMAVINGKLSDAMCRAIVAKLEPLNLPKKLSLEDLAETQVLGELYDGISPVVVCKALNGATFAVRLDPVGQGGFA